jgi:hypothetical protein
MIYGPPGTHITTVTELLNAGSACPWVLCKERLRNLVILSTTASGYRMALDLA